MGLNLKPKDAHNIEQKLLHEANIYIAVSNH